jgi:hypothetical protein
MEEMSVRTLAEAGWKAEIYSTAIPGEFRVVYEDDQGHTVEQTRVTGISSYHQREGEILDHLHKLRTGEIVPEQPVDLSDPGEY